MSKYLRIGLALLAAIAIIYFAYEDRDTTVDDGDVSTLRFRLESFSLSLDPANILDTQSRRVIDMLHSRLINEDVNGQVTGELAQEWEWLNPLTLEVALRPGMTFSNGKSVRAADVAWSLCRHVQPTAVFLWLFDNIEHSNIDDKTADCTGLRVIDEVTLQIHLTHSPERLMHALASSMGAVVPEKSEPGEYANLPGAGPYKIARIESNAVVELTAHKGGPIQPSAKRAEFRHIPDDATAAAQFAAGELDALEIANPRLLQMVGRIKSKVGVRSFSENTHQVRLLIVNIDRLRGERNWTSEEIDTFIHDLHSVARSDELSNLYGELGKPVSSDYFPARDNLATQSNAISSPLKGVERQALQIISENDAYSEQIAATLPKQLGAIELDYIGLDKSLLIDRLVKKNYDIASITLEALVADPVYWASFFKPGSPFTLFGTALPELADIEPNRDNILTFAKIIDDSGNWVVLFQERRMYLFNVDVVGERLLPTGLLDFSRMSKEH
ncbi:MAG: ABC transporter substrate-binding protein [Candidatus Thiodiazotropha sp.]